MSDSEKQAHSILVERPVAHVALVTINRPQARNAVDETVAAGLERALLDSEADADVWAVVLTGAGPDAFCAGADLKAVAAGRARELYTESGGFAGFAHARRTKPWIACVNGFALAGGLEIALACDMIVASENASFGLPEVRRGLVAAAGGLYRLPRALPRPVALELIATGGTISAARAHHFGLVSRLAPVGSAKAEAMALAETIAANAPIAVRESLAIARRAYDLQDSELYDLSEQAGRRIVATEDFQEGPRAFVEKRPPRWTGR